MLSLEVSALKVVLRPPCNSLPMQTARPSPTTPSDHELVVFAKAELPDCGDSFETLMQRYHPRVVGRSRRILGCEAAAQDIAQEVFLSVFRALSRYVPERPFQHWLDVITTNACRQALRRRGRELSESEILPEEVAAVWVAPDPLLRNLLDRELNRLHPLTRDAVRLRFSEGQSFVAIARQQGMNVSTVKMRVKRAQASLRLAIPQAARPSYTANAAG